MARPEPTCPSTGRTAVTAAGPAARSLLHRQDLPRPARPGPIAASGPTARSRTGVVLATTGSVPPGVASRTATALRPPNSSGRVGPSRQVTRDRPGVAPKRMGRPTGLQTVRVTEDEATRTRLDRPQGLALPGRKSAARQGTATMAALTTGNQPLSG